MRDKAKARILRRIINDVQDRTNEAVYMDCKMDGSGELGTMIREQAYRSDYRLFSKLCNQINLDEHTMILYFKEFFEKESHFLTDYSPHGSFEARSYFERCEWEAKNPRAIPLGRRRARI